MTTSHHFVFVNRKIDRPYLLSRLHFFEVPLFAVIVFSVYCAFGFSLAASLFVKINCDV